MRPAAVLWVVCTALALGAGAALLFGGEPEHPRPWDRVDAFAKSATPALEVDLAIAFGDRVELLDPRTALPAWHRFEDAHEVSRALASCQTKDPPVSSPALIKSLALHRALCAGDEVAALLSRPPWMHPSGRSFAEVARRRGARVDPATLHVTEAGRDRETRLLASLGPAWGRVLAEDSVVRTSLWLGLVEGRTRGPPKLRLFPRAEWDAFESRGRVRLIDRPAQGCARPATPALCFELDARSARATRALIALGVGSSLCAMLSLVLLIARLTRARRRDRTFQTLVMRTLAHELRTPATTITLELESLRDAFDELPERCQAPVLRLADGVGRLQRSLHLTSRYAALFDEARGRRASLTPTELDLRALVDEVVGVEAGVEVEAEGSFTTDAEWLAIIVKNLVENAARHGAKPVRVHAATKAGRLTLTVSDAGDTRGRKLKLMKAPFVRTGDDQGLGLGLAIVSKACALLGGTLSHQPAPTRFVVSLPTLERR